MDVDTLSKGMNGWHLSYYNMPYFQKIWLSSSERLSNGKTVTSAHKIELKFESNLSIVMNTYVVQGNF